MKTLRKRLSFFFSGDLTTVRLTFDVALNPENSNTKEWRKWLAQRLQVFLSYTVTSLSFALSDRLSL